MTFKVGDLSILRCAVERQNGDKDVVYVSGGQGSYAVRT